MKTSIYPGWWQVAIAMLIQAISAGSIFTSYSLVAAPLKAEFEPSNMVLMLGITMVSLISGLCSPVIGAAIDRFSTRSLMLLGLGLVAVGFLLVSMATAMIQVIVVYAIFMAVGSVLLGPIASSTLLARWFTRRRGMAMSLAASGGAIGGLLLPPLLQGLIEGYEWRWALRLFAGGIFLVCGPLIYLLVIDRPADRNIQGEADGVAESVALHADASLSMASVVRKPTFWLISLMMGTLFAGPMGVISNMIQLVSDKGVSAAQGAFLLSIFSGANFIGKLLCAGLIDRSSLRGAMAVMLMGMGCSMVGFLQADSYWSLLIASAVCGLSGGAASPVWSVMLARTYGAERLGKVMGLMTFIIMPFTLLSPPVFGRIFDQTGSYDNAFLGYMAMLVFALLMLTQLRIHRASVK